MVVITGGTGLAPVKSMLNMFYDNPDYVKSVTLISGFKNEEGIIFKNDLDKWHDRFTTFYTLDRDQKEGWNTGFVTEFVSKVPFSEFDGDYEVVIVGPPPMMKFTGWKLLNAEFRKRRSGYPSSVRCPVLSANAATAVSMRFMFA